MSFLYIFLSGILIGTAMVVPGVSGGIIAVILGIYDKMIKSLNNLHKDFKNNFIFLFVLIIGVLIGAVWFSNVLIFLYNKHQVITKLTFIGLILGGIPYLFSEIRLKKEKFEIKIFICTIIFIILLFLLSNNITNIKIDNTSNFLTLLVAGFIYSVGKVIPGISGSFLLILIGAYEFILSIMAHPFTYALLNIDKVIPFLIGLVLGIFILLKIISFLLEKKFGLVYSIIIGFTIGSILSLVPSLKLSTDLLIGIILMIISFVLSYFLLKNKKIKY